MELFEIKDGYSIFKITYSVARYTTDELDEPHTYFAIARHAPEAVVALFDYLDIIDNVFEHLRDIKGEKSFSLNKISAKVFYEYEYIQLASLNVEKCDILDVELDVNISICNILGKNDCEVREYLLSAIMESKMLIEPKSTNIDLSDAFLSDILASKF